jgi:hypothetical protein
MAPNLTAVPDFAAKRLRWYQHFDIDTSSRALVNLTGGVETNTLNVCQVELVGTCDPAHHASWGSAEAGKDYLFWPQAPDWGLTELAVFLRWMRDQHGVPLTGPDRWPAYPGSYGATSARMTGPQWEAFNGICGHLHVPENVHGDPGNIDFARLIALAKDGTTPEEDPMAGYTKQDIHDAVWKIDDIKAGSTETDPANTAWQPQSYLKNTYEGTVKILAALANPQPVTLTDAQVQALATNPALAENIAELVAVKLAARLAS